MKFFNFGSNKDQAPTVTPEQPQAAVVESQTPPPAPEQLQVPPVVDNQAPLTTPEQPQTPVAEVNNQTLPATPEQEVHKVSDEEVQRAMGAAAGILGDVSAAEAAGTLDVAPQVTPKVPSVAAGVAELDDRIADQSAAAPDVPVGPVVTNQEIIDGLQLPEVSNSDTPQDQ